MHSVYSNAGITTQALLPYLTLPYGEGVLPPSAGLQWAQCASPDSGGSRKLKRGCRLSGGLGTAVPAVGSRGEVPQKLKRIFVCFFSAQK